MNDAVRLGQALMEPPVVTPTVSLTGTVYGDSAQEVAELARDEAHAFFKGVTPFTLSLDVQIAPDRRPSDPKYVASYWAQGGSR